MSELKKLSRANSERKRIPMNTPVQRLEVPAIPGYHLHWFTGTPERLQRCLDGGYEFVEEHETSVTSASLGGDSAQSGNTDMGSRVSIVGGKELGRDGQPVRLVLMKIRQEYWKEDQQAIEERSMQTAAALCGGALGSEKEVGRDAGQRYLDKNRTSIPDMFRAKRSS